MKRSAPSHAADPETSKATAKRVPIGLQRFLVLEALSRADGPLTNDEIHAFAKHNSKYYKDCLPHALSTRRGVLEHEGYVKKIDNLGLSKSGNPAGRYGITPKGLAKFTDISKAMRDE